MASNVSFYGNEEDNKTIFWESGRYGVVNGAKWFFAASIAHFIAKEKWPAYRRWGTPRHVYLLGTIFVGASYFYAETEELRLQRLYNQRRLLANRGSPAAQQQQQDVHPQLSSSDQLLAREIRQGPPPTTITSYASSYAKPKALAAIEATPVVAASTKANE